MPIVTSDIQYRLSGGSSNTNPLASLGGAISSQAAGPGLFDDVASDEALSGDVEYRCYYIRNGHASLTAIGVKVWIQTNTPSSDTDVALGLGTSAVSGVEQTVANENTGPAGVTFTSAANEGASLSIGDLTPGQTKAVWVRRTVNSAAAGPVADSFTLRAKCDTLP